VPVVRGADGLSLAALEQAIGDVARRAREGKLAPGDLAGGTFTITNGGVFGSLLSTADPQPAAQSGILGMHKIEERPVGAPGPGRDPSDDVRRASRTTIASSTASRR